MRWVNIIFRMCTLSVAYARKWFLMVKGNAGRLSILEGQVNGHSAYVADRTVTLEDALVTDSAHSCTALTGFTSSLNLIQYHAIGFSPFSMCLFIGVSVLLPVP